MEDRILLELSMNNRTRLVYLFIDEICGYEQQGSGSKVYCSYGREFTIDISVHRLWELLEKDLKVTLKKIG